jgi:ATP-dependent Clp protease ATP-binding subunit ClpX
VPPQGGRKHPQQEFIQIDTTNVLFIVAGAFAGLETIVGERTGKKGIGFGSPLKEKTENNDIFKQVQPEDLRKFGLIPEFIGRLPVIATVEELDRDALIKILTEPKNALIKQYQRMFEIDGFDLEFEPEAIEMIADQAVARETGARGLRAILEEVLGPIMFELPGSNEQGLISITADLINGVTSYRVEPIANRLDEKSA